MTHVPGTFSAARGGADAGEVSGVSPSPDRWANTGARSRELERILADLNPGYEWTVKNEKELTNPASSEDVGQISIEGGGATQAAFSTRMPLRRRLPSQLTEALGVAISARQRAYAAPRWHGGSYSRSHLNGTTRGDESGALDEPRAGGPEGGEVGLARSAEGHGG